MYLYINLSLKLCAQNTLFDIYVQNYVGTHTYKKWPFYLLSLPSGFWFLFSDLREEVDLLVLFVIMSKRVYFITRIYFLSHPSFFWGTTVKERHFTTSVLSLLLEYRNFVIYYSMLFVWLLLLKVRAYVRKDIYNNLIWVITCFVLSLGFFYCHETFVLCQQSIFVL